MLRTSEILDRLVANETAETMSLAEIVGRLRARSFGVLLILFAAPNMIPTPPGFSTIGGVLVMLVAIQLVSLRRAMWMPETIAKRRVQTSTLVRIIGFIVPKLRRIERFAKPRAIGMTRLRARQPLGLLVLLLGLIMALPLPVVGNIPPAIAITLIGFGLIERDGVWVGAGIGVGILDIGVIIGLAFGLLYVFERFVPAGWLGLF